MYQSTGEPPEVKRSRRRIQNMSPLGVTAPVPYQLNKQTNLVLPFPHYCITTVEAFY